MLSLLASPSHRATILHSREQRALGLERWSRKMFEVFSLPPPQVSGGKPRNTCLLMSLPEVQTQKYLFTVTLCRETEYFIMAGPSKQRRYWSLNFNVFIPEASLCMCWSSQLKMRIWLQNIDNKTGIEWIWNEYQPSPQIDERIWSTSEGRSFQGKGIMWCCSAALK